MTDPTTVGCSGEMACLIVNGDGEGYVRPEGGWDTKAPRHESKSHARHFGYYDVWVADVLWQ